MATAQQMLTLMAGQIGYLEKNSRHSGPGRGNWTKFADEAFPAAQSQPWCATSEAWGFMKLGMSEMHKWIVDCWANCAAMERRARKEGMWIARLDSTRPGDIVIFDIGGKGHGTHTGILERKISDTVIQTLEGNTSPGNAGSQSNGGGYYRRRRSMRHVRGFIRPPYGAPAAITRAPLSLPLEVDGELGAQTRMAFERYLGRPVDGSWDRMDNRALQSWAGRPRTGILSRDDIRAFETKLGLPRTGKWTSDLNAAMQRFLNRRHADGSLK